MSDFPTLETPRLQLREIVTADAPALLAIHSNKQAMQWFGMDPITEIAQAQALVDTFAESRTQPNSGIRWGIQDKAHDELLGNCGLFKWNRQWKSCSLGFALGQPAWGKGIMSEALQAMLVWSFEQMQLHRIEATVHPQNQACLKLLERLGFVQEGRLRQAGFWLGEHQDLLQLSLLRAEFEPSPISAF
ncbi:GNAT family N-acetyltransferase [Pseudomonas frederiksbergensis]|uniref:GNAT family N-acetyltransferase n=1 Tax=Pseudomonas frederiksbergensis TaxID=104087 RepID=A0A423JSY9_9PSED|nr:GNAT family protein [Pseudomonas frederiksbergensis]RON40799.1 GNAT family N-acetyltransferase [Pseudomonas frederiksbergensis]